MILSKLSITYAGGYSRKSVVPAKEFHEYRKMAWLAVGEYWHDHFRDKHFTKAGAKEYGYTPRAGEGKSGKAFWRSYTGRKQRILRHSRPLVYSGKSWERAKRRKFKAGSRGAKSYLQIILNIPAFNYRNRHSQINMREEMTRVTDQEVAELVRVHDEAMTRLFAQRPMAAPQVEVITTH